MSLYLKMLAKAAMIISMISLAEISEKNVLSYFVWFIAGIIWMLSDIHSSTVLERLQSESKDPFTKNF